jgi:hypothetical protein
MKRAALLCAIVFSLTAAAAGMAVSSPDRAIANRAQIGPADLPAGWRTAKDDSPSSGTKCADPSRVAKPSGKALRDFAKGDVAELRTIVAVYRREIDARKVYSTLARDSTWDCLTAELKKGANAPKSIKHGRYLIRVARAQTVGREILAAFEANGITVTAYIHVDLMRKGRAVAMLFHFDVYSLPLSLGQESGLLRRIAARLP